VCRLTPLCPAKDAALKAVFELATPSASYVPCPSQETEAAQQATQDKETNVKKLKKLAIKKVTLRNLDEPSLDAVAGGATGTCVVTICPKSCDGTCGATCHTICSTLCHTC